MTGRKTKAFLFILFVIIRSLTALEPTVQRESRSSLFSNALGLTEVVISNNILWFFNRYVNEADYGMISFNSVVENISHSWVWDQDEFSVNHIGHPFQGSVYYGAGRSSGNSFYESAMMTLFGSISWELILETERPSINDLLVTTTGGIAFGEMLFRLSNILVEGNNGKNPLNSGVAAVISPYGIINRYITPDATPRTTPVSGLFSTDVGYGTIDINRIPKPDPILETSGITFFNTLFLDYGNLFSPYLSAPYDWFSLKLTGGSQLREEIYLSLTSEGYLKGWSLYGKNEMSRHKLGFFLNYDFIYNKIINLGSNALGPGWIWEKQLPGEWSFQSRVFLNYVVLGASDLIFLKYKDLEEDPPEYERRNYSLTYGLNAKVEWQLAYKDRFYINSRYQFYNFYIIDTSVPEEGSDGIEIIGAAEMGVRYYLINRWFIGVKGTLYHKESYYGQYSDLDEQLLDFSLSTGFSF